ncbi:FkbM family methyltransferase [Paeniroseomonas aquatica]|uniref:FkbM family methyltransferase n=1 Tax=Paeniroseomonas aquatica TaxID=373043 RepID=A0ABT8A640_9PROT|nr:FkbM family methyltransferase [Paeniroseomonas aquatica]MDN3565215.1 FkbM family methyltransferase [Paeniroseomonas aquatica]
MAMKKHGATPLHGMLRRLRRGPEALPPPPEAVPARAPQAYCYLGQGRAVALTHRGHKIFLDTRDLGLTPHIATHGIWEAEVEAVLVRLLRPGQQVAEVGANMGYHTLAMAEAVGTAGRLDCFEANPAVLPLLRATLAVNGLEERVRLHPVAALEAAGSVEFTSDPEHIGSGHLAFEGEAANYSRRALVPAVTLDAALADGPPLDLLRMDAEGSEPQVLRGARALLARSPGLRVVTEWSAPMMAVRSDLGALLDWLHGELGFGFWRIAEAGRLEPVSVAAMPGLPHGEVVMARGAPG